ncbi:ParA family protein [Haloprofundus halobius]|uniref:ParA family protein n=1 Tax=Haloprofundus halobius TaxID=2876194 RepID=UPI001CCB82B1|nr:ParA family protein [Haloprofundus halobius]
MHSIAVTNQKGGVGKTTITAHLAVGLARRGHRVLAIDLDPQGYLTRHFGLKDELYRAERDNLALHLTNDTPGEVVDLAVETDEGVDLVPSNYDMRGVADALSNARNRERRLQNVFSSLSDDAYDYLVVDSPPNLGVLTDNAILASRRLLIPIQAEDSSLDALEMVLDEVEEIEVAFDIDIEILGIVPNLVPRDGVAKSTLETMRSTPGLEDLVLPYEIRKRADIKYAMRRGETLYAYNESSDMISVFDRLAEDVERSVN